MKNVSKVKKEIFLFKSSFSKKLSLKIYMVRISPILDCLGMTNRHETIIKLNFDTSFSRKTELEYV